MDEKQVTTILIGLGIALVLGLLTARSSNRREPVYGGPLAHLLHYLGAGLFVAILPTVLTSAFIMRTGEMIPLLVLGFFGAAYVALLLHAIIERPALLRARAQVEDHGWTEEDARNSGL